MGDAIEIIKVEITLNLMSKLHNMEKLKNEYKKAFGKYQIPETLQQLMDFESKIERAYYSEGFELRVDDSDKTARWHHSLDKEYFERLMVFAMADHSGSDYAFWVSEVGMSLEEAPIILIGSEGDLVVVAKNIKELLKLLSFGPEICTDKFYILIEDYEAPENAAIFRQWMVNKMNVQPIDQSKVAISKEDDEIMVSEEVDNIMKAADKAYGEPFRAWMMTLTPQH